MDEIIKAYEVTQLVYTQENFCLILTFYEEEIYWHIILKTTH
jgi:hypothetical protein